jgi:hypothetical protein
MRTGGGGLQVEDDGRLLEEVRHGMLETVLPKTGGTVMIVGGSSEIRGMRATLLHKNKDTEQVRPAPRAARLGEGMRII